MNSTERLLRLLLGRLDEAVTIASRAEKQTQRLDRIESLLMELTAERDHTIEDRWLNADEVAAWLGRSPRWVKSHGRELGGERDGSGRTARWMFKRELVEAGLPSIGRLAKVSD